MKRLAVLALGVLLGASPAFAKDLRQRLGIGMKSSTSLDLPEIAAIYHPANEIAIVGGLGMDTKKDYSKLALNAGVRRMIFFEEHLNFYIGGNLGIVNLETAGDKQSGWELNAVFGTEFFFAGLDNLGFSVEAGAGVVSMREVRFRTLGDNPFRAGIVFYF